MSVIDKVRPVVDEAVEALGAHLYDLEFHGGVLRVTVQRSGGIDLDELASANRAISRALDELDPIPGRYTLEVSSPGLERTLRTPDHWRGAIGERVKVKLFPDAGPSSSSDRPGSEHPGTERAQRRFEGVVDGVDDEQVRLRTDDGSTQTITIDQVERARTSFEWGPQPKPGANSAKVQR
ncbi:MAG TPA: ribosome maturation factor RimP [Microthrixaceae bacterium]|nr:ribosome maturation factor RimP [Microthrixaceae bacterium]